MRRSSFDFGDKLGKIINHTMSSCYDSRLVCFKVQKCGVRITLPNHTPVLQEIMNFIASVSGNVLATFMLCNSCCVLIDAKF